MRAVNLIPSEQRQDSGSLAGRSQGAAIAVLGLMAGIAILAVLYGVASHQVSTREAEATQLQARAQQAQSQASRLAPYTSFVGMREQRAKDISTLVASRFDWPQAFQELARVLPATASLSAVSGVIGTTPSATLAATSAAAHSASSSAAASSASASSAVTSATPPGSTPVFTITGCATSQSEVAATLERLRLITGVSEVNLQSSSKSGSGSSGASGCPADAPVFTVQVSFQPLPAASSAGGSASSGSASPAALTTSSSSPEAPR